MTFEILCPRLVSGSRAWDRAWDVCQLPREHSSRKPGMSLVVQCIIVCLPMQGTWVRPLIQEDSSCREATKLVSYNSWACELQILKPVSLELELQEKPPQWEACSAQQEPPVAAARETWSCWALGRLWAFVTPRTVALQVLLSRGLPRQECWSGLPFPYSGDRPNPGIEPGYPAL